jgi:hypothetical protein
MESAPSTQKRLITWRSPPASTCRTPRGFENESIKHTRADLSRIFNSLLEPASGVRPRCAVLDDHSDRLVGRIVDDYQAFEHAARGNTVEEVE